VNESSELYVPTEHVLNEQNFTSRESFQAINCTGTENQTQQKTEKIHKIKQKANKLDLGKKNHHAEMHKNQIST